MIEADLIEAVIGIAPNLFYGTGIPACVLIINQSKPKARKGKVLIINAENEYAEGRNQNALEQQNVKRIKNTYKKYKEEERFSRIVPVNEIAENDYNLNITRYVSTAEEAERIDVKAAFTDLKTLQQKRNTAEATMMEYIKELGYE